MREKTKKILLIAFALMLVFGAMPFGALQASAATSAGTKAALIKALNNGGDIKLTKNIDLSAGLSFNTASPSGYSPFGLIT